MDLSKIDVTAFLEELDVEITSYSGVNAVFCCPLHGESHPSARMNIHDTRWICSGCGEKGNAVSFLVKLRGLEWEDARYFINQRFGCGQFFALPGELEKLIGRNLGLYREPEVQRVWPNEHWVDFFRESWEADALGQRAFYYMLQRGFTRQSLDYFGIGFDRISRRVAISVRDSKGHLIGFKGRAVDADQEPRYLYLWGARYGFEGFPKSQHVYGLERVPQSAEVVVCEGELNAVAVTQKTGRAAVAVAGSEFSTRQRELICDRCLSAVIYFDDDDAGRRGAEHVASELNPYVGVRVVVGAPGDAADLPADEISDLLAGAEPALYLHARGDIALSI